MNLHERQAQAIAEDVLQTNTDDRGAIYLRVAEILRLNAQGYSASLFEKMAETYGYGDKDDQENPV